MRERPRFGAACSVRFGPGNLSTLMWKTQEPGLAAVLCKSASLRKALSATACSTCCSGSRAAV